MLKIIGLVIAILSYLTAAIVDIKYKVELDSAYWYLWGVLTMIVGFIPFLL